MNATWWWRRPGQEDEDTDKEIEKVTHAGYVARARAREEREHGCRSRDVRKKGQIKKSVSEVSRDVIEGVKSVGGFASPQPHARTDHLNIPLITILKTLVKRCIHIMSRHRFVRNLDLDGNYFPYIIPSNPTVYFFRRRARRWRPFRRRR